MMDPERLFRDHGHVVLRRARQILGSAEAAEEALQDIFARLVEKPDSFGGRSSPTTFLYSVTTHYCLNRLRDDRTRARLLAGRLPDLQKEEGPRAEATVALAQTLTRIPEELAIVLVYYYLDELSIDEMGGLLGRSRRQVTKLLKRAQSWLEHERRAA